MSFNDLNERLCRTLKLKYNDLVIFHIGSFNHKDIVECLRDCHKISKKRKYDDCVFLCNRKVFLENLKMIKHKGKYKIDVMEKFLKEIENIFFI